VKESEVKEEEVEEADEKRDQYWVPRYLVSGAQRKQSLQQSRHSCTNVQGRRSYQLSLVSRALPDLPYRPQHL
jgi:hypothetical protein